MSGLRRNDEPDQLVLSFRLSLPLFGIAPCRDCSFHSFPVASGQFQWSEKIKIFSGHWHWSLALKKHRHCGSPAKKLGGSATICGGDPPPAASLCEAKRRGCPALPGYIILWSSDFPPRGRMSPPGNHLGLFLSKNTASISNGKLRKTV